MIAETASPASSIEGNAASCVVTASGLRSDAKRDLGRDPERPLRADERPDQVGPVRVERLAAELDDLPVGEHDREARDVVHGEAVLEAVRAARVLRHVAADRAHLLARRIGRVEEAVGRDGLADVEVRHAGLDDDALRREVDLENPLHPGERDDDAVGDRERAAGEAGAGAAGDERYALAGADPDDPLHLCRRAGEDDELRHRAPAREPVAVVGPQLLRLADHVGGADDGLELGANGGGERHSPSLLSARSGVESMIDYRGFGLRRPERSRRIGGMIPIDRPGKIICVGLNYRDHAEEQGVDLPKAPLFFAKYTTSLIGPGDAIVIPSVVEQCDYEAELGVVIGQTVKNVSKENAFEAVKRLSRRERRLGS